MRDVLNKEGVVENNNLGSKVFGRDVLGVEFDIVSGDGELANLLE